VYLPSSRILHLATLGVTLSLSRIRPKGVSGAAGVLHESGCPTLVLSLWPWSHLFLLFITIPWLSGVRGLPTASPPPWSFLPMGIGEWRCGHLAFESFHLGDTLLGNTLSWRCFLLATLPLGDACPWRHPTWATPCVDFDLDADFDLDFVNARVRDGTTFKTFKPLGSIYSTLNARNGNCIK